MFEESECPLSRFIETYMKVFDPKKFPIKNLYKSRYDSDPESAKYLNPDPYSRFEKSRNGSANDIFRLLHK